MRVHISTDWEYWDQLWPSNREINCLEEPDFTKKKFIGADILKISYLICFICDQWSSLLRKTGNTQDMICITQTILVHMQ